MQFASLMMFGLVFGFSSSSASRGRFAGAGAVRKKTERGGTITPKEATRAVFRHVLQKLHRFPRAVWGMMAFGVARRSSFWALPETLLACLVNLSGRLGFLVVDLLIV